MVSPANDSSPPAAAAMREALQRADDILANSRPVLSQLLVAPDLSMFSDEIVARIRGMAHDLVRQLLRAQTEAAGSGGNQPFAREYQTGLVERLLDNAELVDHFHGLAMEWQLIRKMEAQAGQDPVLSALLQQLIASEVDAVASTAMTALSAQARYVQYQRRMELPLVELPADLFHTALLEWREYSNGPTSDTMIRAEAKLRNAYDEGATRIALFDRLIAGLDRRWSSTLDIEHSGVGLFLSILTFLSGQSRTVSALSTSESQIVRLALALRHAGLTGDEIRKQVSIIHRHRELPLDLDEIAVADAGLWLNKFGDENGHRQ